jgi:hypothetical protein
MATFIVSFERQSNRVLYSVLSLHYLLALARTQLPLNLIQRSSSGGVLHAILVKPSLQSLRRVPSSGDRGACHPYAAVM